MDVPLLSQDEFFRHLNLQSVHAAAKFHYRHALKERLRASSIALRKERAERLANEKSASIIFETASPCKLMSPKSSNRLFGRPVIRKEVRVLGFDEYQPTSTTTVSLLSTNGEALTPNKFEFFNGVSPSKKPSILTPLFVDSRVFRHPGIKRELEERTKLNGFPPSCHFPLEDYPPQKRARIEVRHCYYPKPTSVLEETKSLIQRGPDKQKKDKIYRVSFRLQSTSSSEAVEWERKMAAALTLFGHPRKSDVLSTFPFLLLNGSQRGTHLMTSSSGKRSPSLPPATHCDVTTTHRRESPFSNGNNNNNEKELRLCVPTSLNNSSGDLRLNGLNLSPTVQLEKLPLLSANPPNCANIKPDVPRGSRPLLHRKAKDEPLVKPPPPIPILSVPAPIEKRKIVEITKPVENSFVCPICQKCFSSAVSLLQHGEQTHLKCQSCGASG